MASIRCWASAMSTCGRHDFLHRLPCTQAITPACTYTHTRACTYAQHTHSCTQTDQLMRLRSCEGVSTQIGLRSRPISNFASFPYPPPTLSLSLHPLSPIRGKPPRGKLVSTQRVALRPSTEFPGTTYRVHSSSHYAASGKQPWCHSPTRHGNRFRSPVRHRRAGSVTPTRCSTAGSAASR